MLEAIILGAIQGITEWLPVSSEGLIVIVQTIFFKQVISLNEMIQFALFLHLGTLLSAVIYFRKDLLSLFKVLINYRQSEITHKKIFNFLVISTAISGLLGLGILKILSLAESNLLTTAKALIAFIALMLIITGILQLKSKMDGIKSGKDLSIKDGIILGLVQGLAVIPGLSRSGLTISALLLEKFNSAFSLRLSFLMSIPVVLGANIVLNFQLPVFSKENIIALFVSFVFGILTIKFLLKVANKINFGLFVMMFGLLMLLSLL